MARAGARATGKLPLRTSTFTLLSQLMHSRDLVCAGSKVTRCARTEGRCLTDSGPLNRLRPAFKASTLSLGMRGSTIATTIAHSIDTHGWARISLPGYTNLVLRRIFRMRIRQREKIPHKNSKKSRPSKARNPREITRDKILFIMITKAGNQQVRVGNHRNPERTSYRRRASVRVLYC